MKSDCQALCLVLVMGTGFFTLVSAGRTNNGVIAKAATAAESLMPMSTPNPTAAPLLTSTKAPIMIFNTPPKLAGEKKVERAQPEGKPRTTIREPAPLQTPPVDTKAEAPKPQQPNSAKPLQVTGFITKNGNIYEVQDKNGVGLIEGRQNPESVKESHVCNYGSVVIYSDVPCDQVTNVRIGEVQHSVINTADPDPIDVQPQPQPQLQQEQQQQHGQENEANSSDADNNDDNEIPDFDESTGPVSRPKRRRGNKNNSNRRRGNGNRNDVNRKRPNRVRQGENRNGQGSANRRPFRQQPQQQQRRRQQFNRNQNQRRRQQQQQQQRRRNQNGNKNRNTQRRQNQRGQSNRRPAFGDYGDDEERKA